MVNLQELSKEISYALRHAPWEYELEMDNEGWVLVDQLLHALNISEKWKGVTYQDLLKMISSSGKQRHEIVDGKIRAFYGHSIPMKIEKLEQLPPEMLYHGTTKKSLQSIENEGLNPRARQYVHLSQDIETATAVGKRRDEHPVILKINAMDAYNHGVKFYYGNQKVWLADNIPIQFVEKNNET